METIFRLHDTELTQQFLETIKSLYKNREFEIIIRDTPQSPYDWTNPSRSATEEEFENMLAECENQYLSGKTLSSEDALEETLKTLGSCQAASTKR